MVPQADVTIYQSEFWSEKLYLVKKNHWLPCSETVNETSIFIKSYKQSCDLIFSDYFRFAEIMPPPPCRYNVTFQILSIFENPHICISTFLWFADTWAVDVYADALWRACQVCNVCKCMPRKWCYLHFWVSLRRLSKSTKQIIGQKKFTFSGVMWYFIVS